MKIKKVLILLMLCLSFLCIMPKQALATVDADISGVISGMGKVKQASGTGRIARVLNAVIKLIQIAGTGISVLMVTMLGVKYMLSSSSEKAEIKKSMQPILIGCVLLFAAVNLVAVIASVGASLK